LPVAVSFLGESLSVAIASKTESTPWYARRRSLWLCAAAAILFLGAAALWSYQSDSSQKERLRQQVRTQVPIGSSRQHVEQWAQRELGSKPSLQEEPPAKRPAGRTLARVAGVPEAEQDVYLMVTIPMEPRFISGRWGPNQMWVFLPLDAPGNVRGHYFLTLDELAKIEAEDRNKAK
jgi:hypothetical protein